MKKLVLLAILVAAPSLFAQSKSDMLTHYKAFYNEMRLQGDINGVINALTHLNVIGVICLNLIQLIIAIVIIKIVLNVYQ